MKPLFIFCCLLLILKSKAANDTLTRAQVYNFSVGDTFDYKIQSFTTDFAVGLDPTAQTWYTRMVIVGAQYFPTRDSLFVAEDTYQVLPDDSFSGPTHDTITMDSSLNYAALDFIWCEGLNSITFDTCYNHRIVNEANIRGSLGCFGGIATYASGLGVTRISISGGDGDGYSYEIDTTLIYYSKSGQTWGTPANIAVGIPTIPQQNLSITLIPTINNGQFKLSITDATNPPHQLIIYDLTGREVKRIKVTNGANNVTLDNASAGMYLWSVTSDGATLKSGKLIIQ